MQLLLEAPSTKLTPGSTCCKGDTSMMKSLQEALPGEFCKFSHIQCLNPQPPAKGKRWQRSTRVAGPKSARVIKIDWSFVGYNSFVEVSLCCTAGPGCSWASYYSSGAFCSPRAWSARKPELQHILFLASPSSQHSALPPTHAGPTFPGLYLLTVLSCSAPGIPAFLHNNPCVLGLHWKWGVPDCTCSHKTSRFMSAQLNSGNSSPKSGPKWRIKCISFRTKILRFNGLHKLSWCQSLFGFWYLFCTIELLLWFYKCQHWSGPSPTHLHSVKIIQKHLLIGNTVVRNYNSYCWFI